MIDIYQLIIDTPGHIEHFSVILFLIIIDFIGIYLYNQFTVHYVEYGEFNNLIWYWLIILGIDRMTQILIQTKTRWNFETNIELTFRDKSLEHYSKLNHITKVKEPLIKYNQKLSATIGLINMIDNFGIYVMMNVLSAIIEVWFGFTNTMYVRNTILFLVLATLIIICNTNRKMIIVQKQCREKGEKIQNKISIVEVYFELGKKHYSTIIDLMRDKFNTNLPTIAITKQKNFTIILNELMLIFIAIISCIYDVKVFNAINSLRVIMKISNNIRNLSQFLTCTVESKDHWNKYVEFWNENEKNLLYDPIKQDFPNDGLTIEKVYFERDTYTLSCYNSIYLKPGSSYLIRGNTATGKSTFCDLIQGKDMINEFKSGLTFMEGNVRNFSHHICECSQECSGRVKWDISTLRQHFNDEENDELIHYFCKIVCIENKVCELGLDEEIEKRVSGGEQQRITLASNLHFAHINKSRIIIFDEPEKGLGKMAKQVINNIIGMNENKSNIIIISSHDTMLNDNMFTNVLELKRDNNNSIIDIIK
jgi:ABC-type lipoprotein export system ATPase subunit